MADNNEYGILVDDDDEPIVKNMLLRKGFTKRTSALENVVVAIEPDLGASKFTEITSQNPDSQKQLVHQTLNL